MKEKTLYTCEICHTDYADKAEAQKCEREHMKVKSIKDFRYHARMSYPTKIEVEFSNGTKHWYKL